MMLRIFGQAVTDPLEMDYMATFLQMQEQQRQQQVALLEAAASREEELDAIERVRVFEMLEQQQQQAMAGTEVKLQQVTRTETWLGQAVNLCQTMEEELPQKMGRTRSKKVINDMMKRLNESCYRTDQRSHLLAVELEVLMIIDKHATHYQCDAVLGYTEFERDDLKTIAGCLDASGDTGVSDAEEEEQMFAKLPFDLMTQFGQHLGGHRIMAWAHVPVTFSGGIHAEALGKNEALLIHHTAFGDDDQLIEVMGVAIPADSDAAAPPPLSEETKKQQAIEEALAAARDAAMEVFDEDGDFKTRSAQRLHQLRQAEHQRSESAGFVIGSNNSGRSVVTRMLKRRYRPHGRDHRVSSVRSSEQQHFEHADFPDTPQGIATQLLVLYRCSMGVKRSWSKFERTFVNAKRIHIRDCHLGRQPNMVGNAIDGLMLSITRPESSHALEELLIEDCTVAADTSLVEGEQKTVPVTLGWFLKHVKGHIPAKQIVENTGVVMFSIPAVAMRRARTAILRFKHNASK